jgi:hypothetical protein
MASRIVFRLITFRSGTRRSAASSDGKSFTRMRWSTPLGNYRAFGSHRIISQGEGVWHAPSRTFAYLQFDLDTIEYNTANHRPISD